MSAPRVPNLAMDEELKRKLLFTLLALVIYRIGAHIAAPGVNVTALADFMATSRSRDSPACAPRAKPTS